MITVTAIILIIICFGLGAAFTKMGAELFKDVIEEFKRKK